MKKELWLEFGFLQKNNYQDVCWCNEGRWQELFYFIKNLWSWRNKTDIYFLYRFGNKNHYLIKKINKLI